jgi:hypothetical protein
MTKESVTAAYAACVFLIGSVLLFAVPFTSHAQWRTEVNLTEGNANSWTNDFSYQGVQADGQNVHVVYEFEIADKYHVFYKRSSDDGSTWGQPVRLSLEDGESTFPCIAASGSSVHVVWENEADGAPKIKYSRSLDAGLSWENPVQISMGPDTSRNASLSVDGNNVRAVWTDNRDGTWEVYFRQSSDAGETWGSELRLTEDSAWSYNASLSASNDSLYLTWLDRRTKDSEIFFQRSFDGGNTWSEAKQLTALLSATDYPKIAVRGMTIHVTFIFCKEGSSWDVAYLRSTDAGTTWEQARQLSFGLSFSWAPSLAVHGEKVFIVWADYRNGTNGDIFGTSSEDAGATWTADVDVFPCTGGSYAPSLAAAGSALHLLWCNDRRGVYDVYYSMNPGGFLTSTPTLSRAESAVLEQNYPNPFYVATSIRYRLPAPMPVCVTVLDGLGRTVATLREGYDAVGSHEVDFIGEGLPSGIYYVRLQTPSVSLLRPIALVR